ncbi:hypothetical protein [Flagellimonas algicola]|uniref:GRAM domain-containing protein n=1 Tax=Flagellimonas algicola TaxID=2583815 RepID=A0ABY2WFS7_9FLAO|nr:hypothetical protein [Allomuricauda algicola]TMU50367.1 hypothetical protein FGG15_19985 [Allomuricauda algicola]
MNEKLEKEEILKEEKIGFLKSKLNLMQGILYLTPNRLVLDAHKTGVGGFGILGALLKRKVEKKSFGFSLDFKDIKKIAQGKHGVQKNVLEITDNQNKTFRIMVKNYQEWENELNQKL